MRVINRSLSKRGGNAASVHVVQVLILLAVDDVVVDDLETSKARARRGPPMNARSLQRIRGAVPTWPSRPWFASTEGGATSWGTPHDKGPPEITLSGCKIYM